MFPFYGRLGGWLYNAPYLLLTLTTLFWAGNSVLGRYVAQHVPPIALGTVRWVGAFLILIGFAWPFLRADWRTIRAHIGILTVLSFAGISTFNTLNYYGLQFTEAINGLLLQSSLPLQVGAWTFILFGERLSLRQILGILLSLIGTLVIISRGEIATLIDVRFNPGDLYLLVGLAAYAFYSALLKRTPQLHPLSFVTVTMGWGALLLTPAVALEMASGRTLAFDLITILTVIYAIIFPSLLAHFFFYRGVELIGPSRASPFFHLTPVFGTVLAIIFLGEQPHFYHGIGYVLVLAGIYVATRPPGLLRT